MKGTHRLAKPSPAETIARLADQGKDVSRFFKGEGRMVMPLEPVDEKIGKLEELDKASPTKRRESIFKRRP